IGLAFYLPRAFLTPRLAIGANGRGKLVVGPADTHSRTGRLKRLRRGGGTDNRPALNIKLHPGAGRGHADSDRLQKRLLRSPVYRVGIGGDKIRVEFAVISGDWHPITRGLGIGRMNRGRRHKVGRGTAGAGRRRRSGLKAGSNLDNALGRGVSVGRPGHGYGIDIRFIANIVVIGTSRRRRKISKSIGKSANAVYHSKKIKQEGRVGNLDRSPATVGLGQSGNGRRAGKHGNAAYHTGTGRAGTAGNDKLLRSRSLVNNKSVGGRSQRVAVLVGGRNQGHRRGRRRYGRGQRRLEQSHRPGNIGKLGTKAIIRLLQLVQSGAQLVKRLIDVIDIERAVILYNFPNYFNHRFRRRRLFFRNWEKERRKSDKGRQQNRDNFLKDYIHVVICI